MNVREAPEGPQAHAVAGGDDPSRELVAVPNLAVGSDVDLLDAILAEVRGPGMRILDVHSDVDHDRTVLTVAGRPGPLAAGLGRLALACFDLLDVRRRRGVHPRIGVLDVVPIVQRRPEDVAPAGEVAGDLAALLGDLGVPVFLYGDIAADPVHARPHDFRSGGVDALAERMEVGALAPDFGPPRVHPTAGASLVGVRGPLVAWNVELPNAASAEARVIAARVRESGGGLPGVRALGMLLVERGVAQVSMNLERPFSVGPAQAVSAVRREAAILDVDVGPSELVGLVPRDAIRGARPSDLGLAVIEPRQILEAHVPRG